MRGQFVNLFTDLNGQLARRAQDQHLHATRLHIQSLQGRDGKRHRLAGAGLGLPDHIAPFNARRDGLGLDRGGLFKAEGFDGFEEVGRNAEFGKGLFFHDDID